MNPEHLAFLSGATAMGFATAALFFARFWERTRDILFGLFCFAFALLAVEQAVLVWIGPTREEATYVYLLRLSAFLLIVVGIILKNSNKGSPMR